MSYSLSFMYRENGNRVQAAGAIRLYKCNKQTNGKRKSEPNYSIYRTSSATMATDQGLLCVRPSASARNRVGL
jgi:hypothetical protein